MNHLSDQQLIQSLENLVRKEREILNDVLQHLKEIDRRKLFSKLGFTSLFDYATKQLKYSADQAGRRIAAMRLLRDLPEAEAAVVDGSLTLSSLAHAHWHFNKVDHTKEEKREVLAKLQNATKKEAQAILKGEDNVRYSFAADATFENLIEELRGLHPQLSFDELSKRVWQIAYEKLHPSAKIERAEKREQKPIVQSFTSAGKVESSKGAKTSRYIPAEIKRAVWRKAEGKCQLCKSKFGLEYDHIIPYAKGGLTEVKNLRLLCRSCNQRSAIERFGVSKMNQFRENRFGGCN